MTDKLFLIHHSSFIIHHFHVASFYTQNDLFDSPAPLCYDFRRSLPEPNIRAHVWRIKAMTNTTASAHYLGVDVSSPTLRAALVQADGQVLARREAALDRNALGAQ